MTVMASASPRLAPVATGGNARLAAQVSASERKHRLKMLALLAPSVIFTALFFALQLLTGASEATTGTAFLAEGVVAWEAHLGGFLAGLAMFYLLSRGKASQRPRM